MPKADFDKQWLYKPVTLAGIFDHDQEVLVQRTVRGEQGYEILTPMFTGVDQDTGVLQGIFVNRGRIPYEYKDSKMHHTPADTKEEVTGLLFYSEGSGVEIKKDLAAKTGKALGPDEGGIVRFDLNGLIEKTSLSHAHPEDIARKIYVKAVDLTKVEDQTLSREQMLPKPATP